MTHLHRGSPNFGLKQVRVWNPLRPTAPPIALLAGHSAAVMCLAVYRLPDPRLVRSKAIPAGGGSGGDDNDDNDAAAAAATATGGGAVFEPAVDPAQPGPPRLVSGSEDASLKACPPLSLSLLPHVLTAKTRFILSAKAAAAAAPPPPPRARLE